VSAYLHWTISDNWEWADGYCPRFGLVEVQRDRNLTRLPRPSFDLYKQVRPQAHPQPLGGGTPQPPCSSCRE